MEKFKSFERVITTPGDKKCHHKTFRWWFFRNQKGAGETCCRVSFTPHLKRQGHLRHDLRFENKNCIYQGLKNKIIKKHIPFTFHWKWRTSYNAYIFGWRITDLQIESSIYFKTQKQKQLVQECSRRFIWIKYYLNNY